MSELLRVKCQSGFIFITEHAVRVETSLAGRSQQKSIARAMLTGVDLRVYPKVFGVGGTHAELVFYSQGSEQIVAKIVKTDEARRIVDLLGY